MTGGAGEGSHCNCGLAFTAWAHAQAFPSKLVKIVVGYTLLCTAEATFAVNPYVYARLPFDPTMRWHGTMMPIGLRPVAAPAARALPGHPLRRASSP